MNYLEMVATALKEGKIIFLPTETVYGVAIISGNQEAYSSLIELKRRPKEKDFPLAVNSFNQIEELCELDDNQRKIIRSFLPGPLTCVLKLKNPDAAYFGDKDTVAIRYSSDNLLNNLIRLVGKPLFLTSANLSGKPPFKKAEEAQKVFKDKVAYYIEGMINYNKASTIVDLTGPKPTILREGPITLEEIERKLK